MALQELVCACLLFSVLFSTVATAPAPVTADSRSVGTVQLIAEESGGFVTVARRGRLIHARGRSSKGRYILNLLCKGSLIVHRRYYVCKPTCDHVSYTLTLYNI